MAPEIAARHSALNASLEKVSATFESYIVIDPGMSPGLKERELGPIDAPAELVRDYPGPILAKMGAERSGAAGRGTDC